MAVNDQAKRRYRGRTRASMRSAVRHLSNLLNQSKVARTRCLLVPPAQAGNAYPSALINANIENQIQGMINSLNALLVQQKGFGPTCLSEGAVGP